MKKMLISLLVGISMVGLVGCGKQEVKEEPTATDEAVSEIILDYLDKRTSYELDDDGITFIEALILKDECDSNPVIKAFEEGFEEDSIYNMYNLE